MTGYSPTPRQLDALRFIHGFQLAHGWSPSLAEIHDGLGIATESKSSVVRLLSGMEERGLIRRIFKRARAIELLVNPAIPQAPDGAPLFVVKGAW